LTTVVIPNSVVSIAGTSFKGCDVLRYNVEGDLLYLGNQQNLYHALIKANRTDMVTYQINENTKTIAGEAFLNCGNLQFITIPNSVIEIGEDAFALCSSLKKVTLSQSLTSIGSEAFYYTSLGGIIIPDSVTTIGYQAFGFSQLFSVYIPGSVTSIGYRAFLYCTSLYQVCYLGSYDPSTFSDVFDHSKVKSVSVTSKYKSGSFCGMPATKNGICPVASESSSEASSTNSNSGESSTNSNSGESSTNSNSGESSTNSNSGESSHQGSNSVVDSSVRQSSEFFSGSVSEAIPAKWLFLFLSVLSQILFHF